MFRPNRSKMTSCRKPYPAGIASVPVSVASRAVAMTTMTMMTATTTTPATSTMTAPKITRSFLIMTLPKKRLRHKRKYRHISKTREKVYSLKIGDETIQLTANDNKLYQDGKELTNKNGVYTVEGPNGIAAYLAFDNDGNLVTTSEPATPDAKVIVDLAGSSGDVVANDGEMLTGTLKDGCTVTIPKDATVILKDVTIDASTGTRKSAAGIVCEGNATIILQGTNNITGDDGYPAIQAGGQGTTLTIASENSGSLTATGGFDGAGIGSNENHDCGKIEINGGTITANGGDYGAGIGSGNNRSCGDIIIKNSTITAKGGDGGAAGIGTGYFESDNTGKCGNIVIIDSTVTATGYSEHSGSGADIGEGASEDVGAAVCGDIIISGSKVTASDIRGHLVKGDITISEPTTLQKAEINAQDVTFATDTEGNLVVNGTIHPTRNGNKFTFNAVSCDVTATVENGEVTGVTYLKSLSAGDTRIVKHFYYDAKLYTIQVNGKDVGVMIDTSGKVTYNGQDGTDNKMTDGDTAANSTITVDNVKVTLTIVDDRNNVFGTHSISANIRP